ncbi:hypothetical protein D0Z00_004609 [Geotrichum galactomycetum]|uniref:Uncharacterized protein n=1 Tax=Geotrichum galactomycetum TaxID=27317 RepID=A0ACB6UXZ5_9ASCO|nr:hypothetical protein D0Z00_004609 [Geotrichum candidum]
MNKSIRQSTPSKRVKVYELCKDEWNDKGTGLCSGQFINDEPYVVVLNEDNINEVLLKKHIAGEIQFHKQQETLIVWSEAEKNDMALSFQEADGCSLVCDYLVHVQHTSAKKISITVVTSTEDGDYSELIAGPLNYPPTPTLDNLDDIVESFSQLVNIPFAKESICSFLTETNYAHKLVEVFYKAEDLESLSDLHNICRIVKLLYDPAFPTLKANHRQHFQGDFNFKEVVPINDDKIKLKIKQTYRLQFLKDVLARILEDSTLPIFTSMIYFNHSVIIHTLQTSSDYLSRTFAIYKPDNHDIQQKRDGVRFLHEITLASKTQQIVTKKQLFAKMASSGLFNLIEFALNDTIESIRMLGTELLLTIIDVDTSLIRNYSQNLQSQSTFALMQTLVDLFFREKDIGLKSQAVESLKYVLDTMSNYILPLDDLSSRRSSQELDYDVFVASFYTNCGGKLFSALTELGKGKGPDINKHMSLADRALYEQLCDLLTFCVNKHKVQCQFFSIEHGLWLGISRLFMCPHQTMQLAALRCWKQALTQDDQKYMVYFAQNGLVEALIDMLVRMGNKNNLVNSACLDVLEIFEKGLRMKEQSSDTLQPMVQSENMLIIVKRLIDTRKYELENVLAKYTPLALLIPEMYQTFIDAEEAFFNTSYGPLLPPDGDNVQEDGTHTNNSEYTINQDTSPILSPSSEDETASKVFNLDDRKVFEAVEEEEITSVDSSTELSSSRSLVPYSDSDDEEDEIEDKNLQKNVLPLAEDYITKSLDINDSPPPPVLAGHKREHEDDDYDNAEDNRAPAAMRHKQNLELLSSLSSTSSDSDTGAAEISLPSTNDNDPTAATVETAAVAATAPVASSPPPTPPTPSEERIVSY